MATFSAAAVAKSANDWAKAKSQYKFPPKQMVVKRASNFIPSAQQQAYFDWIKYGEGSLVLEAYAGAAKTTSLIEGLQHMEGRVFLGAYNKKIVEELQARVPYSNVKVATMHSVGYGYLKQIAPNAELDYGKMRQIYWDIAGYDTKLKGHEAAVISLVAFAKQAAIGIVCPIDDTDAWYEQIDYYNIDCNGEPEVVIFNAIKTLQKSNDLCVTSIEFEDMLYYPLLKKAIKPSYDWVLADELNDYNSTRRLMAVAMLKPKGRFVGVGDHFQSIYQFSGADHNSMDLMRSAVNAATLPLSVSYRCPKLVVAEAKKLVPDIEAHENAPDGIVRTAAFETLFTEVKKGDVILCRYNAPLIELAYQFILKGIPAKIEGKDIGINLKLLAKKWYSPKTLLEYRNKLMEYRQTSIEKFKEQDKEYLGEALSDKVGCLNAIITKIQNKGTKDKPITGNPTDLIVAEIDAIFGEVIQGNNSSYIVLSSIHKAKGLEFGTVFFLVHSNSAKKLKDHEQQAEKNLFYVAITRAKNELVYIQLPRVI